MSKQTFCSLHALNSSRKTLMWSIRLRTPDKHLLASRIFPVYLKFQNLMVKNRVMYGSKPKGNNNVNNRGDIWGKKGKKLYLLSVLNM